MAPSSAEIKLLTLKAKNFASRLYGVKNMRFLIADTNVLRWHRSALQQLLMHNGVPEDRLQGPYSKVEAMEWVASRVTLKKGNIVNILFENLILISFEIEDVEEFILCAFYSGGGAGFSLFMLNPDVVILVSDTGSEISLYRATRQAGYI